MPERICVQNTVLLCDPDWKLECDEEFVDMQVNQLLFYKKKQLQAEAHQGRDRWVEKLHVDFEKRWEEAETSHRVVKSKSSIVFRPQPSPPVQSSVDLSRDSDEGDPEKR